PKMVRKAVASIGKALGLDEAESARLWERQVAPTMAWSRRVGNAYTASLWIAVASALRDRRPGDRLLALSYGSGFGTELVELRAGAGAEAAPWAVDVQTDLAARTMLD